MADEDVYHIKMDLGEDNAAVIITVEFENCVRLTKSDKENFVSGLFSLITQDVQP